MFINWGINENVDLHWLLTGEGNKFLSSKPPNSIHEQAAPFGLGKIDSETAELLRMSNEILTSDTAFAKSLALSIRTFYLAMNPSKIRQSDSLAKKTEIIKHAVPHIIRAVKLSYYLGLRPGAVELLSLTWEDVNWDSQTILIRSADKGGPRSRQVAIHEDFLEELGSWYRQDEKSGPVVHYQGRAIKYIGRAWRKTLARAGIIRRIRPYDLRHGFITAALEAGADLKALSEIVGSRPETIMRHYQHVSKKLHRETVAKIPPLKDK